MRSQLAKYARQRASSSNDGAPCREERVPEAGAVTRLSCGGGRDAMARIIALAAAADGAQAPAKQNRNKKWRSSHLSSAARVTLGGEGDAACGMAKPCGPGEITRGWRWIKSARHLPYRAHRHARQRRGIAS